MRFYFIIFSLLINNLLQTQEIGSFGLSITTQSKFCQAVVMLNELQSQYNEYPRS